MSQPTESTDDLAFGFKQLRFSYASGAANVLEIDSLQIPTGQFDSLLGPSGSGKSTLLRILAGLLPSSSLPSSSAVPSSEVSSAEVPSSQSLVLACRPMGQSTGMVFQSPNLVPWRNAAGNVRLPSELGQHRAVVTQERLAQLFQLVGLSQEDLSKRPAELSGGMQMRVAVAGSLVLNPETLLLDEPFAA